MATKPRDYVWELSETDLTLTKAWSDGEKQTFDLNEVPDVTRTYLLFLGAKTAGANVHADPMSFKEKKRVTAEWWERMLAGEIRAQRGVTADQLIAAVTHVTGLDEPTVREAVETAYAEDDQARIRQLRSDEGVKRYLEKEFGIRARKPKQRDLRSVIAGA